MKIVTPIAKPIVVSICYFLLGLVVPSSFPASNFLSPFLEQFASYYCLGHFNLDQWWSPSGDCWGRIITLCLVIIVIVIPTVAYALGWFQKKKTYLFAMYVGIGAASFLQLVAAILPLV